MKITGLKKAVGDFKNANAGGYYSPRYGLLMFHTETGELWTDIFYSFGHKSWREYNSKSIVNLGVRMASEGIPVTMANVKQFIVDNFS